MKKRWVQNSLSLLVKIGLLVISIVFLYERVDYNTFTEFLKGELHNPAPVISSFALLWILNIVLDAAFWARVHQMVENVRFGRALKINLICYYLSFITPAQSGEWAGRYIMMNEANNRKKSFFLNIWMLLPKLFSKLFLTLLAAAIVLISYNSLPTYVIIITLSLTWGLLLIIYFSLKKIQEKLHFKNIGSLKLEHYILKGRPGNVEKTKFLLLAMAKFITYNVQFALVLVLFSNKALPVEIWFAIPVYFLIGSLLPTFAFADIILKSALVVWIFQPIWDNESLLIMSSVVIWFLNVVLPAFAGSYYVFKTNLYQSFKTRFSPGNRNDP